jgi:hypothetical protein
MFPGKGALNANELGAGGAGRIAALFEPVGEDQTRRIIVGVFKNSFEKYIRLRARHDIPPGTRITFKTLIVKSRRYLSPAWMAAHEARKDSSSGDE